MADWFYSNDGQQRGPISERDLKQLATSGQLRPDDLVWKEGMAEWAKFSQMQGLIAASTEQPAAAPYNLAAGMAPAAMQPQYAPPLYVMPQYASPMGAAGLPVVGTSGMAIASLVFGLLICVPFSSLFAIVFGIIGIKQTGNGQRRGRGFAIAGLVLGCLLMLLNISILLPALGKARQASRQVKSAANEKRISLAIMHYVGANNGQYPSDMIALAKAEHLDPAVFVSPSSADTRAASLDALESGGHNSYIYLGAGLTNPATGTVVLYEKPTASGGSNVLFGDWSVQFVSKANLPRVLAAGKN